MATTQAQKTFSASLSAAKDWRAAALEAAREARRGLGPSQCDLALAFVSEGFADFSPQELVDLLGKELAPRALLACNASGVIGGAREIEMEPGVAVLALHLPGVKLTPFELSPARLAGLEGSSLVSELDVYPTDSPNFICLADPMSCDVERLLGLFNEAYPGRPMIGGLASGVALGRPNWLAAGGRLVGAGAVGLAVSGAVEFQSIVAQGCRPIGTPAIITKAEENLVFELAGRPAFEVLRETVAQLPAEDRELARRSLFAGLLMNEYQSRGARGDFLIRNLIGYDEDSGALAVGAAVRRGQTLQFQLRDAKTSDEDLRAMLSSVSAGSAKAGFLVSCCGRGRGLYGEPDHDAAAIQRALGPLPLAGFFANGEIGPVGGRNFVHGYTSSLVLIK